MRITEGGNVGIGTARPHERTEPEPNPNSGPGLQIVISTQVVINLEFLQQIVFFYFFGAFRAPGWPETDSPRKMIASSGVETEIRALGTRFVAIFRFRKICDVDYNLSSKIIIGQLDLL